MAVLIFGGVIGFIALMVLGAILGGWALSVTWGWFMVPVFGLPELSIVPAMGIALVIGYLTKSSGSSNKEGGEAIIEGIVHTFVGPLLVVGIGWIILQFM